MARKSNMSKNSRASDRRKKYANAAVVSPPVSPVTNSESLTGIAATSRDTVKKSARSTMSASRNGLRHPKTPTMILNSGNERKTAATHSVKDNAPRKSKTPLHDERNSLETRKERPTCKKRPDSRKAAKGTGGSRDFIPWCKKS